MRLLIFIHSLSSGGTERVATNLANYGAKKGWQITLVTMASLDLDFYPLHVNINRIALSLDDDSHNNVLAAISNNYRRIKALRMVLKQQQPDVALAMMTTANILLAFAAKGLNIPVVGSEHIHPPKFPLNRIWEWLRQQSYGQLGAVTALTQESAHWLEKRTTVKQTAIIPNAVSYPIVPHKPIVKPEKSDDNCFNLIAVGRLVTQKGFDRLILAFSMLSLRFPDWNLIILGEGDCRKALEQQLNELGLGLRVSMPGVVGNLGEWYELADLFVMTSRFEGFGNTLVEAMAYGLPVVSVDCETGPRNIIRNGIDGLLVPQNNQQALIEALSSLMGNKALREQYSHRAVEARERFSIQKIAGMWESLFDQLKKQ